MCAVVPGVLLLLSLFAVASLGGCTSETENPGTGGAGGGSGGGSGGAAPKRLKVFVSSAEFVGAQLSTDPCPGLAVKAGLGPSFRAWLSNSAGPAKEQLTPSPTGWETMPGSYVAADMQSLTDGTIQAAIRYDEYYEQVASGTTVWTGTNEFGMAVFEDGGALDCNSWTSDGSDGATGQYGKAGTGDASWSSLAAGPCSEPRRVYCFQEP